MTTHENKKQESTPKASHVDTSRPQGTVSNPLSLLNRPGTAARQNPFQLKHTGQNPLKPMTTRQNPLQLLAKQSMSRNNPLQLQAQSGDQQEVVQQKPNNTGLPDKLKEGVENLSGYSMDDVKVHYNSDKPAQLQALAYAQGTDIHVGPGQEKHLPHEAWHVVQQKQRRVQPTMQMKGGVAVNDDNRLEREADVMGKKALQTTKDKEAVNQINQSKDSLFNLVMQLAPTKTWKQNRKRFINPSRRTTDSKKAKWLVLWESKSTLIKESGMTIDEVLILKNHIEKNNQSALLDNYLKLAAIKELGLDEIIAMIPQAKLTMERGYPYPFLSMDQFINFKINIKRIIKPLNINYTDIRIQGSALRKTNPNDIDVGVMVNKRELDRLYNIFITRLDFKNIHGRGRKQIVRAYKNGKFSPRDLAILGEEVTGTQVRVFELIERAMINAVGKKNALPVQMSVILIGGSLDSKPFISF